MSRQCGASPDPCGRISVEPQPQALGTFHMPVGGILSESSRPKLGSSPRGVSEGLDALRCQFASLGAEMLAPVAQHLDLPIPPP